VVKFKIYLLSLFDQDGDGSISVWEVKIAMNAIGYYPADHWLQVRCSKSKINNEKKKKNTKKQNKKREKNKTKNK